MNAGKASPFFEIECEDRTRKFCLNFGAFAAMENYLAEKTGNPDYNIFTDFNWSSSRANDILMIIWAGFLTDAKKNDKEEWTVEKASEVLGFLSIQKAKVAIEKALSVALVSQQTESIEKKTKTARQKKLAK